MTFLLEAVTAVTRVSRYVSMRVHGTSAQVQPDSLPGIPQKFLNVERAADGTRITSNYSASFWVHFAIPTPLIVERNTALHAITRANDSVFKGTSVSVVRVELYMQKDRGTNPGTFYAMDGRRKLAEASMKTMLEDFDNSPEYFEESREGNAYILNLDKRVYTGLGVSFAVQLDDDTEHEMLLIGAKAIFFS